jgi:hypothetical protein
VGYDFAGVSEHVGFATVAHEVSHLFGAHDLYGPWGNTYFINLGWLSIMSGTITAEPDASWSVHHDPWHKIAFGWVEPNFHSVGSHTSCFILNPPQHDGIPVIISFDEQGSREHFILEYRDAFSFDAHYDYGGFGGGLVAYYVKQERPGVPATRISYIGPKEGHQIQSTPAADDVALENEEGQIEAIFAGPNHQVDTVPDPEHEIGHGEGVVLSLPPKRMEDGSYRIGRFGDSGYWSEGTGDLQLEWPGAQSTGIRVRARFMSPDQSGKYRMAVAISNSNGQFEFWDSPSFLSAPVEQQECIAFMQESLSQERMQGATPLQTSPWQSLIMSGP